MEWINDPNNIDNTPDPACELGVCLFRHCSVKEECQYYLCPFLVCEYR